MGPLGCSFPVDIPKSFEPIFIKVKKAAKKPKTANRYIFKVKYFYDNNVVNIKNPVQKLPC